MKKLLLILIIGSSSILQGCVGPGAIQKDYTLQQKKIVVVSELGNNFHHNIVGTTIFTNNITQTDVKDWQINHLAANHLVERLNKHGLSATEIETDFFTPLDGSSAYAIEGVQDKVIERVKPLGYDSLIIIAPVTSELYPFFYPGYGLLTRYNFGSQSSCVYAAFTVQLYDLHTGKKIGWEWMNAQRGPCDFKSSNDLTIKDNFEAYSPEV